MGDFNAKIEQKSYYHAITGNQSLHEKSNDNGTKLENFTAKKCRIIKSKFMHDERIYTSIHG